MITYEAQGEDINSLKSTVAFLNRVMNKQHFSSDYLKWQYIDNPVGKAIAICALENGSVVGHYAAQPIISRIDSNDILGLFILNAAVDPVHQRKGILRGMADRVHDQACQDDYRFMIGVGNRNSTPIYTNSFGFRLLGPLNVKLGIGIPKKSLIQKWYYERIWDEITLKWRLQNPYNKYMVQQKAEGTIIYKKIYPYLYSIMGTFDNSVKPEGSPIKINYKLCMFIGNDPAIEWEQNKAFINFPEFAKPSPLNLIFKELQEGHLPVSRNNMLFRCIDFDAF